jgi:hypothetical protein
LGSGANANLAIDTVSLFHTGLRDRGPYVEGRVINLRLRAQHQSHESQTDEFFHIFPFVIGLFLVLTIP